jgi:hypothetical protein
MQIRLALAVRNATLKLENMSDDECNKEEVIGKDTKDEDQQ